MLRWVQGLCEITLLNNPILKLSVSAKEIMTPNLFFTEHWTVATLGLCFMAIAAKEVQ